MGKRTQPSNAPPIRSSAFVDTTNPNLADDMNTMKALLILSAALVLIGTFGACTTNASLDSDPVDVSGRGELE